MFIWRQNGLCACVNIGGGGWDGVGVAIERTGPGDRTREIMANLQDAMDIDLPCSPKEALEFLMENPLSCNLRVLDCQLGLIPSDLDTLLPPDQSRYRLSVFSEGQLWSSTGLQIKYAINVYKITTGSSESNSIASLQSPQNTECFREFFDISDDSGKLMSCHHHVFWVTE